MCKYCEGYHVEKDIIGGCYLILKDKLCDIHDYESLKKPVAINFCPMCGRKLNEEV